jgi:hypothetical protein
VIESFLESWALFQTTYLAGIALAALLALVGVWVVAREQVFLGAAIAQASTLGIAALLWIAGLVAWPALESRWAADVAAVAASSRRRCSPPARAGPATPAPRRAPPGSSCSPRASPCCCWPTARTASRRCTG